MNNYIPKIIWFTGLSGAGKTTLSKILKQNLIKAGISCIVLDGDELRLGINSDLGYETVDRIENIRRVAHIAKLFLNNQQTVIVATISPKVQMREMARTIIGNENFIEVYVNCSLQKCEKRDVKGLYEKTRAGKILNFTGIGDGYEAPQKAFVVNTETTTIDDASRLLYDFVFMNLHCQT
jgi:adenylyl-sulfate kinase